jgi:antitoxin component YwqK of YwqJK toxin-antitoxin module
LDGKSTWWNKRSQKVRQINYKNGKLDGKLIEWFQFNGEIKREENYKNGKILF